MVAKALLTGPKPRLCLVGPMVGRNPGRVTTQGVCLAGLLEATGYTVISASGLPNRYMRLADIIMTLVKHRRSIDILMLEIYGGRSFVVEDIASRLGKRFGHRIIMVLHGGALPGFMARFPRWARQVFGRADVLVSPSEFLARSVTQHGFQTRIIPNVVDLSAYQYRHRQAVSPRLFWMRTFHPVWNPEMAIRVLARLRESRPEASLVMAGEDRGLEAEVRRLAEELGLDGSVCFSGFLNMQEKLREGGEADIFISTNHVDNMPVAVLEACAMGLPVVATSVGGIPDLLTQGETGLLVPDGDVEGMAEAIEQLLSDRDLASRLSINGRKLAERSSWEQVRLQWERVFAEVMV